MAHLKLNSTHYTTCRILVSISGGRNILTKRIKLQFLILLRFDFIIILIRTDVDTADRRATVSAERNRNAGFEEHL